MFRGSIVALVTPMNDDGSINYNNFIELIDWHLEQGAEGILVAGSTGESETLNHSEWRKLITTAVNHIKERVPVIAGSGHACTAKAIEATDEAMRCGVDACLLISPAYVRPTQEGLYQHHAAIANAVAVPQILYNVPARTATDILPETVERLSHIPNIVGVKEATGDPQRCKQILDLCGDRIDVYSGVDSQNKNLMALGAKAAISVTANVAPKAMREFCEAMLADNHEQAEAIDLRLHLLHENLFIESNPIPVKWALHEMGKIPLGIRLPLTALNTKFHDVMRNSLREAGII